MINNSGLSRYIPGKTYEYIASHTPILLSGEGGEMASIVKKLNAGLVVPTNDADGLEWALRNIQSHPGAASTELTGWLKSRAREVLAYKMLEILDDLRAPLSRQTSNPLNHQHH